MGEDSIYYYTSNYVLKEWLKNETIWATRSVTSNDSQDTTYIINNFENYKNQLYGEVNNKYKNDFNDIINFTKEMIMMNQYINLGTLKDILFYYKDKFFSYCSKEEEIINNNYNKFNCKMSKIEYSYGCFIANLINESSEQDLKTIFNINNNFIYKDGLIFNIMAQHPFVICFSKKKDNRFLWDTYTSNLGVCLEFSKSELSQHFVLSYPNADRNNLFDIIYGDNNELIYSIFNEIKKEFNYNFEKYKDEELEGLEKFKILPHFYLFSPFFKNPYWEPEDEVRAVLSARYLDDETFKIKENYNLKYKNDCKTQDYIEIDIPKNLVKSITTGPLNTKEDVKKFLKEELEKDKINSDKQAELLDFFDNMAKKSNGTGIIKKNNSH